MPIPDLSEFVAPMNESATTADSFDKDLLSAPIEPDLSFAEACAIAARLQATRVVVGEASRLRTKRAAIHSTAGALLLGAIAGWRVDAAIRPTIRDLGSQLHCVPSYRFLDWLEAADDERLKRICAALGRQPSISSWYLMLDYLGDAAPSANLNARERLAMLQQIEQGRGLARLASLR